MSTTQFLTYGNAGVQIPSSSSISLGDTTDELFYCFNLLGNISANPYTVDSIKLQAFMPSELSLVPDTTEINFAFYTTGTDYSNTSTLNLISSFTTQTFTWTSNFLTITVPISVAIPANTGYYFTITHRTNFTTVPPYSYPPYSIYLTGGSNFNNGSSYLSPVISKCAYSFTTAYTSTFPSQIDLSLLSVTNTNPFNMLYTTS